MLPILVAAILLEISLRQIPNNYSYKKNYIEKNAGNINTLILGNSHAFYGFDPKYFEGNAFNAANVSQSLLYDYKILEKYESSMPNLKTVVVPVSYLSLFTTLEEGDEAWRVKNYRIYFDLDTGWDLSDNFEILSGKLKANITRLNKYYLQKKSDVSCTAQGVGVSNEKRGREHVAATGKNAALRHTAANYNNLDTNLKILDSLTALCKKKDIKVVFVTLPAYKSYRENIDKKQYSLSTQAINKFVSNHDNCTYLNYFDSDTFLIDDYMDADHLNAGGAKKLSLMVNNAIRKQ
jgi:hypothetical protein